MMNLMHHRFLRNFDSRFHVASGYASLNDRAAEGDPRAREALADLSLVRSGYL